MASSDKNVAYFYDEQIGNYCYGGGNPMRPHRARMVYSLVSNYGLGKQMTVYRPEPRNFDQLTEYHADDYIDFIKSVCPSNVEEYMTQLRRFNMGMPGEADCPVFDGLYQYCQTYSGGSVDGAAMLASKKADITFNWSGGMHHAKKAEASGFCYVNDIVLAILELLKVYPRVLYVDIDIHHGDGVEEAFYLTDRVMTVSFHKYGEFFPGTGAIDDIGTQKGKYYTVNVPLKDGMDDVSYQMVYEPIMAKVMEMYQPECIVLCCGADSLSGDRLGCFNLSMEGHSHCLEFLTKYNVPMLVLGGGGYTLRNVARCWCYETGRMMGIDLPDNIPDSALEEFNYYLDTQRLRIEVSNMKNANTREELEEIKTAVLQHLSSLPPVPSAQMAYVPPNKQRQDLPEEDMDTRGGGQVHDEHRKVRPGEDSDDEEEEKTGKKTRMEVDQSTMKDKAVVGASNADAAADPSTALAQPKSEAVQAEGAVGTGATALSTAPAAATEDGAVGAAGAYEAASLETSQALGREGARDSTARTAEAVAEAPAGTAAVVTPVSAETAEPPAPAPATPASVPTSAAADPAPAVEDEPLQQATADPPAAIPPAPDAAHPAAPAPQAPPTAPEPAAAPSGTSPSAAQ